MMNEFADSIHGTRYRRGGAQATAGYAAPLLNLARLNTAKLLAILYLQDIFWLLLSRLQIKLYKGFYYVAQFDWVTLIAFVVIALLFTFLAAASLLLFSPLRKVYVPRWVIFTFIWFAILMNFITFAVLQEGARYTSGGLTGITGVIYGVGRGATFGSMIVFIRHKNAGITLNSRILLFGLIGSFALTMDGLANALTLMMFIFLMMPHVSGKNIMIILVVFIAGTLLLWMGITAKWSTIPDYVTPEFLIRWTIARFSIQAEQMFIFLSGKSIIGDTISYIDLITRSISDRLDIVLGKPLQLQYPRSVSEAIYFDVRGYFGAGSSPGILLGTSLQGPFFFFIVPCIYAFIFLQLFYGGINKVTLMQLCAYQFLLKSLHANFSEYLTIVSPSLVTLAFYIIACLMTLKRAK